jgi:hypothetical protein
MEHAAPIITETEISLPYQSCVSGAFYYPLHRFIIRAVTVVPVLAM